MRPTIRMAEEGRLSDTVIDAVAAATGADPLTTPLFNDVIDLDALDKLFPGGDGGPGSGAEVVFEVAGCEVHAAADGRVVAIPPESGTARVESATG